MNKNAKIKKSECLFRLVVLPVSCYSIRLFFYWPFCHGAFELDMSKLFATFFFEPFFNSLYMCYCCFIIHNLKRMLFNRDVTT